jgi:hypothetical protein
LREIAAEQSHLVGELVGGPGDLQSGHTRFAGPQRDGGGRAIPDDDGALQRSRRWRRLFVCQGCDVDVGVLPAVARNDRRRQPHGCIGFRGRRFLRREDRHLLQDRWKEVGHRGRRGFLARVGDRGLGELQRNRRVVQAVTLFGKQRAAHRERHRIVDNTCASQRDRQRRALGHQQLETRQRPTFLRYIKGSAPHIGRQLDVGGQGARCQPFRYRDGYGLGSLQAVQRQVGVASE